MQIQARSSSFRRDTPAAGPVRPARWSRSFALVAGGLVLAAAAGCSGASAPAAPTASPSGEEAEAVRGEGAEAQTAEPAGEPREHTVDGDVDDATERRDVDAASPGEGEEPGDEEWLVDEAGNRYQEERLPKVEGLYRVSEDGKDVFLPPGVRYELVRVEEDAIVVKLYDSTQMEERRREEMDRQRREAAARVAERGEEPAPLALKADPAVEDTVRLARAGSGLPNRGQWRHGFAVVDLDGDGRLDIVHGPPRKGGGMPRVFLGGPEGTWRPWRELRYEGPRLDYGDVGVADFDGDGHLDLAFAVHLRGLLIARGDGEGTFTHWDTDLEYRVPGEGEDLPDFTSRALAVVDWNRDGRPDLLSLSEGPTMGRGRGIDGGSLDVESDWGVGLFLNQGGGSWVRQPGDTLSTQPFGDDLAIGDFDGDGIHDFATAMHVMGAKGIVHIGRENGGFEQRRLALLPPGMVSAVDVADLDGDGRDELLVGMINPPPEDGAEWLSSVIVASLDEDGEWEGSVVLAETGRTGIWAVGAGDVDGDGHPDVLALGGDGSRRLLLGSGDRSFRLEESPELQAESPGCRGYEVRMVDLDGDGRDEMALAFAGEPGGSESIFASFTDIERQCPAEGSLEVWGVAPAGEGGR